MVRWSLVVCMVVALGGAISADVSVVPLQEEGDPFRLTNARITFPAPDRAVIAVNLENRTPHSTSTYQVFLNAARFLTKSEAEAANGLSLWCGTMGHIDGAGLRPQIIAPGASATVELSIELTASCQLDARHQHFFVYVDRVSHSAKGSNYGDPAWQRTSADFARLLDAAMPHP